MTEFNHDEFLKKSLLINIDEKTFQGVVESIDLLRRSYDDVEPLDRLYIERDLGRRLLIGAVDTSQPLSVVRRIYRAAVTTGFNTPDAELSSGVEFGWYCHECGNSREGTRVLKRLQQSLRDRPDIGSEHLHEYLATVDRVLGRILGGDDGND